jgi:hypothetical protein
MADIVMQFIDLLPPLPDGSHTTTRCQPQQLV